LKVVVKFRLFPIPKDRTKFVLVYDMKVYIYIYIYIVCGVWFQLLLIYLRLQGEVHPRGGREDPEGE